MDVPASEIHSPRLLFSLDIDSSIALYDDPKLLVRRYMHSESEAVPLAEWQLDVLVDTVRQSTKLDEDQKDRMVEGIRASQRQVC